MILAVMFWGLGGLAGCRQGATPTTGDDPSGLAVSSPLADEPKVPPPTEAELASLGTLRTLNLKWQLDHPAMVVSATPQRFLASEIASPYSNASATVVRGVPLFPPLLPTSQVERILVSTRVAAVPVPGNPRDSVPLPIRVSEITLVEPTTPEDFFKEAFPNVPNIPTVTSGSQKYYDIGSIANVPPPVAVGIAFPDARTLVLVEGDSSTITEVFDATPASGAAWDRLARLPSDADLAVVVSREGSAARETLAPLFAQFGFPEPLLQALAGVKAATLSANLRPAADGSLLEITLASMGDADAAQIKEQLEGWLLGTRVAFGGMKDEERAAMAAVFLESVIDAALVSTDAGLVRVAIPQVVAWDDAVRTFLAGQEKEIWYQSVFQRMSVLAQAFFQYNATNGFFPHRGIRATDGTPLLSWRVALLPLLGQADLFSQFALNEPWDSEHNRPLADKMPAIFALPKPVATTDTTPPDDTEPNKTTFRLFNSDGTPFGDINLKISQITAPNVTSMFVSVDPSQAVVWTAPDTLACDPAMFPILFPNEFLTLLWNGQAFAAPKIPAKEIDSLIKGTPHDADP